MPTAYAYGRISRDEVKQANSRGVQEKQTEQAYKGHAEASKLPWGGFFFDPATSGSIPLFERQAGRELNMRLQKGDYLFIAKVDRAFRSLKDQILTMDAWDTRGVSLIFLDMGLDTSTDVGRLMMQMLASFAEFERKRIARRTREAILEKRHRGEPVTQMVPIGWKRSGEGYGAIAIPDYDDRTLCAEIHMLRKNDKLSYFQIARKFAKENRPMLNRLVTFGAHRHRHDKWSLWWIKRGDEAFKKEFPCPIVNNRHRYLREVGRLPQGSAS